MAILDPALYLRKVENLEWYLVGTMPRSERLAEQYFLRNRIPCYLPRYNRQYINSFTGKNGKKYLYKKAPVLVPMFPGYIFAALDLQSMSDARRERSIARVFLHVNYTEDELIDDLNKVKDFEFLAQNNQIEVKQGLEVGMRVSVIRGPFKGWEGVITRRVDQNLLWIQTATIGYSMGIEIAAADCEEI